MSRPKVLIEQWLPIDQIGAECMRERGASSALPPLYFLHVWWARRPLTVSRAAILASLLPAYPTGDDESVRPWPSVLLKRFPTFDDYKRWYQRLVGITGSPAAARRILQWAKTKGQKVPNPYEGPRAFTAHASEDQIEEFYGLLEWTWGTRDITFCDPMSGGGTIPFEALRYGLTVYSNELNSVASVLLHATLDFPARYGTSIVRDFRKYAALWCDAIQGKLQPYFTPLPEGAIGACYIWARTVPCPVTGKPVPLSPNWWLRKGSEPVAVEVKYPSKRDTAVFRVTHGEVSCRAAKPDLGTIKRGSAVSPWSNNEAIDNRTIKRLAQEGAMGEQLYVVGVKQAGGICFREANDDDLHRIAAAHKEYERRLSEWESRGIVPTELLPMDTETWTHGNTAAQYDATSFRDLFSKRQLLSLCTAVSELDTLHTTIDRELTKDRADAVKVMLALAVDKAVDYNSRQTVYDTTRDKIAHAFARHDLGFRWSYAEFDASANLFPWAIQQVADAFSGLVNLIGEDEGKLFSHVIGTEPVNRLHISQGTASHLECVGDGAIRLIVVDPPYYDNVNYAECSDFFYVWMKRTLGSVYPDLFRSDLSNKDEEAVANAARFAHAKKRKKELAERDYENKMMAAFREMHRILSDDGTVTVMFTHKRVEAWDTLGTALIHAGFSVYASWPIHTESEVSLHQAKKNAAASTIMLVCRKRETSSEAVWWDDLKSKVRKAAREKAAEFEQQGIKGVDLYISTFGPVLSIISENWPVLTSETDPKTGDPLPLKPGEALDLAREEVVNLRKRGLLLGRAVEFDPVTDWYLMAWDAFRAQEFPADEARKLALALGIDLERDVIRDKKLVAKKSGTVVVCKPADRRKRNMVDADADSFPHLIDALHTAMMIYDEEGSKACQVFIDRQGLRNDSRVKALVQAMMEAIPTTRGKDGKFLRPEMTTLDAMRAVFWEDLPPPKEEEPTNIDLQPSLFAAEPEEEELDDESDEDEGEVEE